MNFDSFQFFLNLFVVVAVILPAYRLIKNVLARRLLLGLVGVYLLWLIAPRLALFYLGFWLVVGLLQWVVSRTAEQRYGTVVFVASLVIVLAPMLTWKIWT